MLAPHVSALTNLIRDRALILYTTPFASIRLQRLADAFGLPLVDVEGHIVRLVKEGQVKGRVDASEKVCFNGLCMGFGLADVRGSRAQVLLANVVDERAELFQKALKAGVESEATARKLILRMKLYVTILSSQVCS